MERLPEIDALQVHDLLQIEADSITADRVVQPPWLRASLRLNEARRLMLTEQLDAATAA
jgi:hypothetical protein